MLNDNFVIFDNLKFTSKFAISMSFVSSNHSCDGTLAKSLCMAQPIVLIPTNYNHSSTMTIFPKTRMKRLCGYEIKLPNKTSLNVSTYR